MNNTEIKNKTSQNNHIVNVTLFHANWCKHCVDFKPMWDKIVHDASHLIKLNSYEESQIDKLDTKTKTINGGAIDGFPTIKINVMNNEYNYVGKRSDENIYKFIIKKLKQHI